jgi:ABC-2 type transport system permease protein
MGAIFGEMLLLAAVDLVFIGILVAVIVPLAAYKKAAYAVLKRNFVGYFSNPTGYVFLCLFVLLTSIAAFWPHEFFTANLANSTSGCR